MKGGPGIALTIVEVSIDLLDARALSLSLSIFFTLW